MSIIAKFMVFFALAIDAGAQTNRAPVIVTNTYTAPGNIRSVNGVLYDIDHSQLWSTLRVEIERVDSSGDPVYFMRRMIRTEGITYVPGKTIVVTNFSAADPTAGSEYEIQAMRNGIYYEGNVPLELWDCGRLHNYTVISTNSPHTNAVQRMPNANAGKTR